jgi:hypothetical protein
MMQRQYEVVLQRVKEGQRQYKDPVYGNRFRIMEAIALAGSGKYEHADTLLKQFISTHPTDTLRNWAESVLAFIKANKPAGSVLPNDTTGAASKAAALDSLAKPKPVIPANYSYKPKEEHYFLFSFHTMSSKAMGLKAGLNDFSALKFSNLNLTAALEMLKESQGIIVVKPFPSAAHAKIYMNSARSTQQLFREFNQNEYEVMIISAENLIKLKADKDMQAYLKFYHSNYK